MVEPERVAPVDIVVPEYERAAETIDWYLPLISGWSQFLALIVSYISASVSGPSMSSFSVLYHGVDGLQTGASENCPPQQAGSGGLAVNGSHHDGGTPAQAALPRRSSSRR